VPVHVQVRQHGKTEWIDGYVTDVFAVRDCRIVEFRSFIDAESASRFVHEH
jgi:limonene-1,2-epoxide hydrolase